MALEFINIKDATGLPKALAVDQVSGGYVQALKLVTGDDGVEGSIVNDTNPLAVKGGAKTANTLTIASGASVSNVLDLSLTVPVGIVMPAAWTTAALNIEVSMDNSTWITSIYDATNSTVGSWSTFTVSGGYALDFAALLPWKYLRLRSGTSGTPVNQGAARAFSLITKPLV